VKEVKKPGIDVVREWKMGKFCKEGEWRATSADDIAPHADPNSVLTQTSTGRREWRMETWVLYGVGGTL